MTVTKKNQSLLIKIRKTILLNIKLLLLDFGKVVLQEELKVNG